MASGLIDTSILIDILRGFTPAQPWFDTQGELAITHFVNLEVIAGAKDKQDQRQAFRLLTRFERIEIVSSDFEWGTDMLIKFGLSHNVGIMDCLIAAPAHRLGLPLYTQKPQALHTAARPAGAETLLTMI